MYSDLYDVPPPENDNEAIKLGNKIRDWIKNGKPKPGETLTNEDKDDDKQEQDENPKKKRGRFGFFRK